MTVKPLPPAGGPRALISFQVFSGMGGGVERVTMAGGGQEREIHFGETLGSLHPVV